MTNALSLVAILLTLAMVLGLAYICSRFLGRSWNPVMIKGKRIQVVEQIPLGADKRLVLVTYRDQEYLLGVSQTGINVIAQNEAEAEALGQDTGFSELLGRYIRRNKEEQEDKEAKTDE